jgi:NAD(P)H-nitrite reductase large subunit
MKKVVIIGNGISGVTAARHIRKLDSACSIQLVSAESKHFFSRTALMYLYMGHMKYEHIKPYEDSFWEKNRIKLIYDYVVHIETEKKNLQFESGERLPYDQLIIASGSKPRKPAVEGVDAQGVQGLYSLQDLQLMEQNTSEVKKAVIVGGGLIGVEMAEMLRTRNIDVCMLVRDKHFWGSVFPEEEGKLIGKHIRSHGVDLLLETELQSIISNQKGRVEAVLTKSGERIKCQFVGITIGVEPNIDFLKNTAIKTAKGVLVNAHLETNVPNVYAIGDCAEFDQHPTGRKNIEQVWYTGKLMGETVAQSIAGERMKYQPGVWFNSAKFFDVEYQTYGKVNAQSQTNESTLYWQHPKRDKCLKLVYERESFAFLGINALGIRLGHAQMDKWIKEGVHVEEVNNNLEKANFDPEFYTVNWSKIRAALKKQLQKQSDENNR